MRLEAHLAWPLAAGAAKPLTDFCGSPVHAVAGIGNPERFFRMLRGLGLTVTAHPLEDHARIAPSDILFADTAPVLMTEKDAVKCFGFADARHWFVPVDAGFDAAETAALLRVVMQKIAAPPTGAGVSPLG
jgi:tetraacyldisaccharide 4'-kinase